MIESDIAPLAGSLAQGGSPMIESDIVPMAQGGSPMTKSDIAPMAQGGSPLTESDIAPLAGSLAQGGSPLTESDIAPMAQGGSPLTESDIAPMANGRLKFLQPFIERFSIPAADATVLEEQGLWFRLLQLVMYLIALGVTTFQALVVNLVLQFNSRLLGLMFGWLPAIVTRLGNILALLLCLAGVALSATVCGSIGIFVCYVVCFVQLLQLCYRSRTVGDRQTKSRFNFFLLLFIIWMWLLMINSPSLVMWAKMVMATQRLEVFHSNPSKVTGTVSAIIFLCLLLTSTPHSDRAWLLRPLGVIIHGLTVLMLVFAMVTLYRVTYIIIASLVLLAAPLVLLELKQLIVSTPRPKTE